MRRIRSISLLPLLLLAACNNYDIKPEQAGGFIKFFSSNLSEVAYDVKETADGGYVAIGTTVDGTTGLRDLYLVKTDKYGNEASWSPVILGGPYDDVGTSLQVVSDGFVILGYSTNSDTSEYDMYLVKTDLQGNLDWETRVTGDASDDRGYSLQITSSGEYLAAGITSYGAGDNQYKIVRFNTGGEVVQTPRSIPSGQENQFILSAYIIETASHFIICSTVELSQKKEIQLLQLNKDNYQLDNAQPFTATGDLSGSCIQELSDGNLLVCGTLQNTLTGLDEVYLNKLSPDLIPVWESPVTFSDNNAGLAGNSVRIFSDNEYAVLGTRTETGNQDMILLLTDGNGNEISRRVFGDAGFQQGVSLEVTGFDGGLILLGNNGAEDQSMMALVKTDASGAL